MSEDEIAEMFCEPGMVCSSTLLKENKGQIWLKEN